jgi:outer membrane protein OmpA-like peptidoglycan-associated protein
MKVSFVFTCIISIIGICRAPAQQNLVLNGSFEEHGALERLSWAISKGQFGAMVNNWDNDGSCGYCHKDYRPPSYIKKGYERCFEKTTPKEGKAMIPMLYSPSANGIFGGVEGASHLSTRLSQPMRVGMLYEVSFWLYNENISRADPDWAKHIGIALLPQNLSFFGGKKSLFLPFLEIDTVIYDAWYKVKWRVRPLCTSNYLMIGVFADDHWPATQSYKETIYFIDNVAIIEIPVQSAVADSSIYYCSRYDPKMIGATPKMDKETLLFQNKAFDLTPEHKAALDSFIVFAKEYPDLVFELSGHTDSIGTDNWTLSYNRVQAVHKYLTEAQKLPAFRLIFLSKGGSSPLRANSTEEDRKMNRRVEIRQTNLQLPMMFYRNALESVAAHNYSEAFTWLNRWLIKPDLGGSGGRIILFFDPRIERLRKDKRWILIEKKIRDEYNGLKYPRYAFLLDSMRLDELKATGKLAMGYQGGLNALPGYIPEIDTVLFELPILPDTILQKKFLGHFDLLSQILIKVGWPKKSEFGESGCNAAFNILIASNEIVEFFKWLPLIQKTCEDGENPWIFYARLYDQCNLALGKPQRYVTDVRYLENGELLVKPWEGDEDTVNDYRAKIGLPLLSAAVADAMKQK